MERYVIVIAMVLGFGSVAYAQQPVIVFENITKCTQFQWDEVTLDINGAEEVIKEYRLKVTRDDVVLPYVAIPPADTTIICIDANVTPGSQYEIHVTAVDMADNESKPSALLAFLFVVPDTMPPNSPGNFCFVGETADGSTIVRCQ